MASARTKQIARTYLMGALVLGLPAAIVADCAGYQRVSEAILIVVGVSLFAAWAGMILRDAWKGE